MENNFANFIHDIVDDLAHKIQSANEKMLIQDIIMIFENKFKNYVEYSNEMVNANTRIDEFDKRINSEYNITFYPKHHIISLDLYNFIIELRRLYK